MKIADCTERMPTRKKHAGISTLTSSLFI